MNPDDPRKASQQVADAIRAEIMAGTLPPGKRIPSIRDLAQRYQVAQMTANNAVSLLRTAGLVYTSPGRGTFVHSDAEAVAGDPEKPSGVDAVNQRVDELTGIIRELVERVTALERNTVVHA